LENKDARARYGILKERRTCARACRPRVPDPLTRLERGGADSRGAEDAGELSSSRRRAVIRTRDRSLKTEQKKPDLPLRAQRGRSLPTGTRSEKPSNECIDWESLRSDPFEVNESSWSK